MEFSIEQLSEERISGIMNCPDWTDECPISLSELREVNFLHLDFEMNIQKGLMILAESVAASALSVFEELFQLKFPLHKAVPADIYNGSDVDSMNDNNSSAFNCRRVMNTDRWSSHAYGIAIDINPKQNPYVLINHKESNAKIYPMDGTHYLNRSCPKKGMVEPVVSVFRKYGFEDWGGDWDEPLDYHHFQVPWDRIERGL